MWYREGTNSILLLRNIAFIAQKMELQTMIVAPF
jgi:hypothetical protein